MVVTVVALRALVATVVALAADEFREIQNMFIVQRLQIHASAHCRRRDHGHGQELWTTLDGLSGGHAASRHELLLQGCQLLLAGGGLAMLWAVDALRRLLAGDSGIEGREPDMARIAHHKATRHIADAKLATAKEAGLMPHALLVEHVGDDPP